MLKSSSQKRAHEEQTHLQTEPSYTPLHQAAIAGDVAAVEVLLVSGADRFAKDNKHGNTALHEAAWRGYSRCVKLLCTLQQTSNVAPPKKFGKKAKSVKNVADEWKNQTYLNTPNVGGFSPLHLAAQNGHNQSCREMLLAGANPDVKNNYGDTPLHTSCRYGHAGATRILISAKCDPICVNLNYDTPLHIACAMGRRKLTRILYEVCGANGLLLRNAQGETPRDIAIRKSLKPIIEILNSPPTTTTTTTATATTAATQIPAPMKCDGGVVGETTDGRRSFKPNSSHQNHQPQPPHRCSSGSGKNGTSDHTSDKLKPKRCINDRTHHDPHSPANAKIWSPYGCHYFPDPRSFPPPKLDTFPKEPLKQGEQYYLDLAGNIRKGPIGIGNTCYCGPFFNHIEQQINQNKKSFKKYVLKHTGKLDGKVQELAKNTDDKIQRIARSIMADHREKHGFDYWPRRSDPLRATVVPQMSKTNNNNDELNNNTLSRCRSLEYLEDRKSTTANKFDHQMANGNLHRSFDLLNNTERHEAIIHHSMQTDSETSKYSSRCGSTNTSTSNHRKLSINQYALDFREKTANGNRSTTHSTLSDAESLADFTNKSMDIIQMKRANRQKFKERTLHELRERQKAATAAAAAAVDSTFLKYPPNFSSTLTAASIDDLRDYHSSNHYPNDFDDISMEMNNITKLLSATLIEPLESAPSTSSSFYHSTDTLAKRFTLYNKSDDDIESSIKSDLERAASNSCTSKSTGKSVQSVTNQALTSNGFFQNTCFEHRSSSSCDTLKSVELAKTNGNATTNGHNDDSTDDDDDDGEEENDDDDGEEIDDDESDTDLEETIDRHIKTPTHLQTITQRAPRPGLVSARIKSLLAKNLQTNKMPAVRSTLGGSSGQGAVSKFNSTKQLLRVPLKSSDSPQSPINLTLPHINATSMTSSTNSANANDFMATLNADEQLPATADSSENEAQITVHKVTVHANQIQTDSK